MGIGWQWRHAVVSLFVALAPLLLQLTCWLLLLLLLLLLQSCTLLHVCGMDAGWETAIVKLFVMITDFLVTITFFVRDHKILFWSKGDHNFCVIVTILGIPGNIIFLKKSHKLWVGIHQLKYCKSCQAMIHSAALQQLHTTKLTWHGQNCVKWRQTAMHGHQLINWGSGRATKWWSIQLSCNNFNLQSWLGMAEIAWNGSKWRGVAISCGIEKSTKQPST